MTLTKFGLIALILVLTLLSGLADSQGFIHAANIWHEGKLVWSEFFKSALGFLGGILLYWVVIRFLQDFSIVTPELQTLGWFSVTIVGVAITSGKFLQWQTIDKFIGLLVLLGIGWLLVRING